MNQRFTTVSLFGFRAAFQTLRAEKTANRFTENAHKRLPAKSKPANRQSPLAAEVGG